MQPPACSRSATSVVLPSGAVLVPDRPRPGQATPSGARARGLTPPALSGPAQAGGLLQVHRTELLTAKRQDPVLSWDLASLTSRIIGFACSQSFKVLSSSHSINVSRGFGIAHVRTLGKAACLEKHHSSKESKIKNGHQPSTDLAKFAIGELLWLREIGSVQPVLRGLHCWQPQENDTFISHAFSVFCLTADAQLSAQ
jgi:hypothetical protein